MEYRYVWDKEYNIATPVLVIGHPGRLLHVTCSNNVSNTLRFSKYPSVSLIAYNCTCGERHGVFSRGAFLVG